MPLRRRSSRRKNEMAANVKIGGSPAPAVLVPAGEAAEQG